MQSICSISLLITFLFFIRLISFWLFSCFYLFFLFLFHYIFTRCLNLAITSCSWLLFDLLHVLLILLLFLLFRHRLWRNLLVFFLFFANLGHWCVWVLLLCQRRFRNGLVCWSIYYHWCCLWFFSFFILLKMLFNLFSGLLCLWWFRSWDSWWGFIMIIIRFF